MVLMLVLKTVLIIRYTRSCISCSLFDCVFKDLILIAGNNKELKANIELLRRC